jgi:hypothetical protein
MIKQLTRLKPDGVSIMIFSERKNPTFFISMLVLRKVGASHDRVFANSLDCKKLIWKSHSRRRQKSGDYSKKGKERNKPRVQNKNEYCTEQHAHDSCLTETNRSLDLESDIVFVR